MKLERAENFLDGVALGLSRHVTAGRASIAEASSVIEEAALRSAENADDADHLIRYAGARLAFYIRIRPRIKG